MAFTTYEAICACYGDGRIYFGNSPDATHFVKPDKDSPLFDVTTSRTPMIARFADTLHMVLTDQDGRILLTDYDRDNQAWNPVTADNQPLKSQKVYNNGGYTTPALVALNDLWVFFVDPDRRVWFARFDNQTQTWQPPARITIANRLFEDMTEDTPSFTLADNQLLMCMADTDGIPNIYYATDATGRDLTNWLPATNGTALTGVSTYNNRTPTLYFHHGAYFREGLLWMVAQQGDSELVWANWQGSQLSYDTQTPMPLFPEDNWKSDFPPSLYTVLGELGMCLCDRQGRVYFTTYQDGGWIPVTDPYTPWDDWTTVNNSTPRLCSLVQSSDTPSTLNWMSGLDETLSLSQVSIPGTHDSCTYTASSADASVRCQSATFQAQLQAGVRFFDLRLGVKVGAQPPDFELSHGGIDLDLTFSHIYADALNFLAASPKETLIFCIKDTDDNSHPTRFGDTLAYFTGLNQDRWYTGQTVPILKDVRGRIVLFRRFANPPERTWGIDLSVGWDNRSPYDIVGAGPAGTFYIQDDDEWTAFQMREKYHLFAKLMIATSNQALGPGTYVNFSSASTGAFPITFATFINPAVKELIAQQTVNAPILLGIVVMDFVDEQVAAAIALSNFD